MNLQIHTIFFIRTVILHQKIKDSVFVAPKKHLHDFTNKQTMSIRNNGTAQFDTQILYNIH